MPMARALKHVDLELEEALVNRLHQEAEKRQLSLSELVGAMLSDDLGKTRDPRETAQRIRQLRKAIGPMPDSTPVIRTSRDQGW
jgi:hypothetical protein